MTAACAYDSRPMSGSIFPAAARANPQAFHDQLGRPRSIGQVCAELARRYQAVRAEAGTAAAAIAGPDMSMPHEPAPTTAIAALSAPQSQPDRTGPTTKSAMPVFHSLFQTGERRDPLSPAVTALWGASSGPPAER